jgi:hypothetical protein
MTDKQLAQARRIAALIKLNSILAYLCDPDLRGCKCSDGDVAAQMKVARLRSELEAKLPAAEQKLVNEVSYILAAYCGKH